MDKSNKSNSTLWLQNIGFMIFFKGCDSGCGLHLRL